jgi:hypothetical protein
MDFMTVSPSDLSANISSVSIYDNNSYRINVYRFGAFWLDKSTVTCLFFICS